MSARAALSLPPVASLAVLLWSLTLTGLAAAASVARPLVVHTGTAPVHLLPYLDVLEDPSGALTIDDVTRTAAQARFRQLDRANEGLHTSAFWLRFTVSRAADAPRVWVLDLTNTPRIADLFVPVAGGYVARRSGTGLPFDEREILEPPIAFVLEIPDAAPATYYARVETDDTVNLEIELSPESVASSRASSLKLEGGLFYGAMLVLIAYNVLIFAATRDRAYVMYACFELAWVLMQASMDKYAFQYLWPWAPGWAFRSEQVFATLAAVGSVGFGRTFLSLDSTAPRMAKQTTALIVLGLALAPISLVSGHPVVVGAVTLYSLVCGVSLLVTGGVLAFRRVPNALLYIVAWSILSAGGLLQIAASVGILQVKDALGPMKLGSVLEAVLLSLGLARRVDVLRRERAAAQQRLSRAREERLAALGRLVAGFAHEIGNPLNFALGGAVEVAAQVETAERLLAQTPTAEELQRVQESVIAARRAAALVLDGNERIKRLLDNLRRYVRARDVEPVATDVREAIRSTLAMAAPLIDRTKTRVRLDLTAVPPVDARPGELEQVLMNLVVNACQAMGEGGEVVIATCVVGRRARIEVSDTGPGIPQSRREVIFEPFYTSQEGDAERSGLGLYVSYDIVMRHGGELRVEDAERGARFVMELPLPP